MSGETMVTKPPATTRRRPTSYEVARAAGVAQSTVSRCFRDDGGIAPATRTRVLAVADALGYAPNALARSLILRRSGTVAVVVTTLTFTSNPLLVQALGRALESASRQVFLVTVDTDEPPLAALRALFEYPLDGVVSCAGLHSSVLDQFRQRGVPVILVNRRSPRSHVDQVTTDHPRAARHIATLLVRAGHRDFVCVGGPKDAPVSSERLTSFIARLADLSMPAPTVLVTPFSYEGGRDAFLAAMEGRARPDAVYCVSDQLAFGVMDACRFELGWSIPEDLSVTGFDDVAEARRPVYRLTTLHQDVTEMARMAVSLLLRREQDFEAPGRRVRIPAQLIPRVSARLTPARRGAGGLGQVVSADHDI